MIPDKAREVLSEAQLAIVEQLEAQRGIVGLDYDVMTGAVHVTYPGHYRAGLQELVVTESGSMVVPTAGMSVNEAMEMFERVRTWYEEQNGGRSP